MTRLAPVDLSFLATTPKRSTCSFLLPAPRPAVFAQLGPDPSAWGHWCPGLDDRGHYISLGPVEAGSVRRMYVARRPALETVLAYEQDRRFAFRIDEAFMPGIRAFAEDYVLEDDTAGSTRVAWTIALQGAVTSGLLGLVARAVASRMRAGLTAATAASA